MSHSPYVIFPVNETIDLSDLTNIRQTVDKMVQAYLAQESLGKFSYRILLPREEKSTAKAKRIGIMLQGELLLGLRRQKVVPNIREVRYLHDEKHYGWLLANPQVFEQFEKGNMTYR